jgi:hypothetical protein
MKPLSRRSVATGIAVALAAIPVASLAAHADEGGFARGACASIRAQAANG